MYPFDAAVTEVQTKIEDLQGALTTLLRLQAKYGGAPSVAAQRGNETGISHDTFFGMTIGDAARKYLDMTKSTKSPSDIADALERGGLKLLIKGFSGHGSIYPWGRWGFYSRSKW